MNKKILAFSLSYALLVSALGGSVTASAAETNIAPAKAYADAQTSGFDYENKHDYKKYDDFEYYINDNNTVTVTGHYGDTTELVIPDTIENRPVTAIEARMNYSWQIYSIEKIYIPKNVESISGESLGFCANVHEFVVDSGNNYFCAKNGNLFSKDMKTLVFVTGNNTGNFTVPDGVESIGDYAFYWRSGITGVTLPKSLKTIGELAFSGCTALTECVIPKGVTTLGNGVFFYCSELRSVTIPDSVVTIGYEVFYSCEKLTSVTIPDSVTSIGDEAFIYCTGLKEVYLSKNLKSIGHAFLCGCTQLEKVDVPEGVAYIGNYAFARCENLTEVYVPDSVAYIGDSAFEKESTGHYDKDTWEWISESIPLDKVTITGIKDSYAEEYAAQHNIKFRAVEKPATTSYGDLDGDNVITSADALIVLRASVGLENLTEAQKKAADVDGDGQITSADSLAVLRWSVGLRDEGILIQ